MFRSLKLMRMIFGKCWENSANIQMSCDTWLGSSNSVFLCHPFPNKPCSIHFVSFLVGLFTFHLFHCDRFRTFFVAQILWNFLSLRYCRLVSWIAHFVFLLRYCEISFVFLRELSLFVLFLIQFFSSVTLVLQVRSIHVSILTRLYDLCSQKFGSVSNYVSSVWQFQKVAESINVIKFFLNVY